MYLLVLRLIPCLFLAAGAYAVPEGIRLTEGVIQKEGGYVAESSGNIDVPLTGESHARIVMNTGTANGAVSVVLQTTAGRFKTTLNAADVKVRGEKEPRPDGAIEVVWPHGKGRTLYHVRPNLNLYDSKQREAVEWERFPKASGHSLTLDIRQEGEMLRFYLDGRFVFECEDAAPWESLDIHLEPGARVISLEADKVSPGIFPVDLTLFSPASFAGAVLPTDTRVVLEDADVLPPGLKCPTQFSGIPVAGLGRLELGSFDLQNAAWEKNGLQGLPETLVASVPLAAYDAAWVLCAAEDDPTRHPSFVLRLTRYGNSRGDAMADTEVTLPPKGMEGRRVGTVHVGDKRDLPLWLVKVPLKTGEILDLLQWDKASGDGYPDHRYLDLEILDQPPFRQIYDDFPTDLGLQRYSWYNLREMPKSSVYLFGLALERCPASFEVETRPRFAAFYAGESPTYVVRVNAMEKGKYTLKWESADIDGQIVQSEEKTLDLDAGKGVVVEFPVTAENGWYSVRLALTRVGDTAPCMDYRGSFVMLPPDKRKVGADSPFGTWWFNWAHGGSDDMAINGPVFLRAGLRKTILDTTNTNLPESVTAPYKVYLNTIRWMPVRYAERKNLTVEERLKRHEEWIRRSKERWPSVDRMLVWHESGSAGAPLPSELWDEPAPPVKVTPREEKHESWEERMEYLPRLAKMVREKFPSLKLQYGNDGDGLRVVGQLFRNQFPREYVDSIASEVLGLSAYPESYQPSGVQSLWYLRETARKMGYPDVPVTACVEWISRRTQGPDAGRYGAIGLRTQAEWYVRDAIHALSYGVDSISLGTLHDAGNAYYHTQYGAGGLTRRYPEMQPKPAYAAMATLTQVLDSARYVRSVRTDLLSLHVEEFQKGDEWIYALWCERGERSVDFSFEGGMPELRFVDLYGRERESRFPRTLVSTAVEYIISPSRLKAVSPGSTASYPMENLPPSVTVASPMDTIEDWSVTPGSTSAQSLPRMVPGNYTMQAVEDEQRGSVLELKLNTDKSLWGLHLNSGRLRMKTPHLDARAADGAGVWVKGNGSGARIRWIIRNEDGTEWLTNDWPTWRYDDMGWFAVNFDGWHYVRYPFKDDPRWKGRGSVVGLQVIMPRQRIHGSELVDIPDLSLRFSDLGLYSESPGGDEEKGK